MSDSVRPHRRPLTRLPCPWDSPGKNTGVGCHFLLQSLLLNMLSRLVITFLPRSKRLLISWLQSPSAVMLEPPPKKFSHCFHCFPIYLPWSDGTRCHDLSFWMLSLKPTFSLSSFTFIKRLLSSSSLSAIRGCHLHIWGYWYFSRQSWFQLVLPPAQRF